MSDKCLDFLSEINLVIFCHHVFFKNNAIHQKCAQLTIALSPVRKSCNTHVSLKGNAQNTLACFIDMQLKLRVSDSSYTITAVTRKIFIIYTFTHYSPPKQ